MLEFIKSLIYGIVQGITEWLPISSTGHLILFEQFLKFELSAQFMEMFRVVIQLGSILAVVILYWNTLWPFEYSKKVIVLKKQTISMWLKVAVACVPAAVVGILFDDILDEYFYNPTVVATMLIVVGILFIVIENLKKGSTPRINTISQITYGTALAVGIAQVVAAVFPGTSRSGATIIAALAIGVSRAVAAEFTFFLAIPVMFGASLLKLVKLGFNFTPTEMLALATGTLTALIVSIFAIKFLMSYIKKNDFKPFGYYRIVLGILVIAYFNLN